MKRILPLVLLCLGVAVAALFGARLGPTHEAYRADLADGSAEIALPPPRQRLGEWVGVGGAGWLVGVGFILVGAVIARRQVAAENAGGEGEGARVDFPGTVRAVRAELDRLAEEIRELPFDDDAPAVREALDNLSVQHLEPLVDGRGQLVARHGLARFASYFGPYSAAERKLARCWSGLTDGHPVVAREALDEARAELDEALAAWERAEGR